MFILPAFAAPPRIHPTEELPQYALRPVMRTLDLSAGSFFNFTNVWRFRSARSVQRAQSGNLGMPIGS